MKDFGNAGEINFIVFRRWMVAMNKQRRKSQEQEKSYFFTFHSAGPDWASAMKDQPALWIVKPISTENDEERACGSCGRVSRNIMGSG